MEEREDNLVTRSEDVKVKRFEPINKQSCPEKKSCSEKKSETHHLCPLMTYSFVFGSKSNRVLIFVASDDATPGSVMANADRISPESSGSSHFSF